MTGMFQLILALFCWLPVLNAQYGGDQSTSTTTTAPSSTSDTSSSTSASSSSAVHSVDVGEDGFTFDPDTLTVSAGDKVEFHFYPGNHSVAQSSFAKPCQPLSDTSIFSGFVAPTSGESDMVFTLTVNDTDPIWLYCAQIGHCQAGMVAVINPPASGNTLTAFKAAAALVSGSSEPAGVQGGTLGTESASSSTGSSSSESTSASESGSSTSSESSSATTTSSPSTSTVMTTASSTSNPTSTSTTSPTSSEGKVLQASCVSVALVLTMVAAMFMV